MRENIRKSGISIIGDVPWGTHICQFYRTKEDLLDMLIPYFKAGLENNEFCLWVISEPLQIEDARESLIGSIPAIDIYLEKRQIEIIPYTGWFTTNGVFDSRKVSNKRKEKLNCALDNGYDGMRLSGNTSWLEKGNWDSFIEFKEQTDKAMDTYKMINLCTYPLDKHNAAEIIDVVVNHQYALIKREGKWKRVESSKRKIVEKALSESEEKYRNLVETANEGILIIDAGHRIIYVNEKMAEMFGCSREKVIGKSVRDFTDYEGKAVFEKNMIKRRQGINESHEFRFLNKDGSPLWTHVNSKSLFDKDGNFNGSMSMLTDITKRKEAETKLKETLDNLESLVKERTVELENAYKSLKESEARLAKAQKIAHVGSWEWDIATERAYWSDELYHIFRLCSHELAPTYYEYLNFVHPDDRNDVADAFRKAINGKPYSIDHRIVLANGEERVVHEECEVIFNDENSPTQMIGTVQDVTERIMAEEKIKILANVVESSNDAIITESLNGVITSWNRAAEQIYGFSAEEMLGKDISILEPDNLKGEIKKLIEKTNQKEKIQHYETLRLRKDGTIANVSVTLSPIYGPAGSFAAVSCITRDITERKKVEKLLANIELVRKKEIHHRIKNNLQVIYSLLDLQAEMFKGRKNIKDSEVLNGFRESQDRVISIALIHEELYKGENIDVLNFSKYIKELAENLLLTFRLDTDINLNFDLEENIFLDMDTAIPLGIVINELVTNSFKYAFFGRDKGEIRIRLRREEIGECKTEECKIASFILSISDNGVGIPEDLEIEDYDSLGLQLVTSLVDQLDGELELKRDNGTEFIIRFTITEQNRKN
jgi:PAS domain S-box-containing protein